MIASRGESSFPPLPEGDAYSLIKTILIHPDRLGEKWISKKNRCKFLARGLMRPISTFNYLGKLCEINTKNNIFSTQSILPTKIHRPYLRSRKSQKWRAEKIVEHYHFVEALPLLQTRSHGRVLAETRVKNDELLKIIIAPSCFDKEGECTMSFNFNGLPLARITFSIITNNSKVTAFIGGLQGPPKHVSQDEIRKATKLCYGLFPKRVLLEAFCCLVKNLKIEDILAVSEQTHIYSSFRYKRKKEKVFLANYSQFWASIGGVLVDGVFRLPLSIHRKDISNVASKKRAEYRNRYSILDEINLKISDLAKSSLT